MKHEFGWKNVSPSITYNKPGSEGASLLEIH